MHQSCPLANFHPHFQFSSSFAERASDQRRARERAGVCIAISRRATPTYLEQKAYSRAGASQLRPGQEARITRGALAVSTLPASVGRMSTAAPARPVRSPVKTRRQSRNTSERSSERDRSERDSLAAASRERNHVDSFKLRRVVVNKKLVVRRSASLESDRVGDVTRGKVLLVVDEDLVDGVIRCHLGKDSSPRGVAVHNVGWVTAAKDGELKLTPIKEEGPGIPGPNVKVPEPTTKDDGKPDGTIIEMPWSLRLRSKLMEANIDPSFTRLNMPSTPVGEGQESMASRIASMRLEKQRRHQRATASAPAPAASEPEPDAKETTKEVPVEAKFVWATSAELNKQMNHIESSTDAMEKNAHAKFDTVEAQLGRLLNERKIKLEDLMKEWDRNRDGDISKQEFRLHVKKLGLDADTGQIDALYDSLDLDGSGSLDTDEMKEALRKMQEDVRNVKDSVNRVLEHVANMRKVIVLFQTAANNTLVVEAARFRLDAMRAAVKEDSAASRIANTLTAQDLKLTDLDIGGWEADGKKFASAAAFSRAFEELEAEVTPEEIAAFFKTLDFSSNDILDVEEVAKLLYSGGAKTTAAKQQSRKAEEAQVKNISSVKSIAEASQKTARAGLLHAEGVAAEKEAEIKEATAAKAASMQTSKVEEQKQKGKRKGTTVAKFMAS